MKRFLIVWCGVALLGSLIGLMAADAAPGQRRGLLRHVVCFKFKDSASAADIKGVEDAFRELKAKIPNTIVSYEWGTNVSPENLNQGFTHCFILGFLSAKDRDTYLNHPEHKAFGKMLGPFLDKVMVVDFWVKH